MLQRLTSCAARPFAVGLATLALSGMGQVLNAEEGSPWQALPADTVAMLRMPDARQAMAAFGGTKLGQILSDPERVARMQELLSEAIGSDLQVANDALAEIGFGADELLLLLAGDTGVALILEPDDPAVATPSDDIEQPFAAVDGPTQLVIAWSTPGADVAGRLLDAVERTGSEQGFGELKTTCERIQLGSAEVIHLQLSEQVTEFAWDEERGEPVEKTTYGDPQHLLMHATGDQLFMAASENVGLATISNYFTTFITDQGRTDGGFATGLAQVAGATEAVPAGVQLVDAAVYLDQMWSRVSELGDVDLPSDLDVPSFLKNSGFDSLSLARVSMSIDQGMIRQSLFAAIPSPRLGFMRMLEQPSIDSVPPKWVPADAVQYVSAGFDMAHVMAVVREVTVDLFGPNAEQGFAMADAQVAPMLGVPDLQALWDGLGTEMRAVYFPVDPAELEEASFEQLSMVMNRVALVMSLDDVDLWTRVVQAIGGLMMAQGMPAQMALREGWVGYDFDFAQLAPGMPMFGVYVGFDNLVVTVGQGVGDRILPAIADPAAAGPALADAEWFARSQQLVSTQPAWSWSANNMEQQILVFDTFIRKVTGEAVGDWGAVNPNQVLEILPTAEEWGESVGVGASRSTISDTGVLVEAVTELKPIVD